MTCANNVQMGNDVGLPGMYKFRSKTPVYPAKVELSKMI